MIRHRTSFVQNLSFQAASLLSYLVSSTFHGPSGLLFIFRSRYYFTIGLGLYLDLPACIWFIHTRKPSRITRELSQQPSRLLLRGYHALWLNFPGVFIFSREVVRGPHTTSPLGFPRGFGLTYSAFARRYSRNHYCFLFLLILKCFTSQGSLSHVGILRIIRPQVDVLFEDLGVSVFMRLTRAFRSLSRSSSVPKPRYPPNSGGVLASS